MAEEKNDNVVVPEVDANVIRNHELFQKQAKLASDLKAKLEAYESKAKNFEEEKQKKLLEEKGNFEALMALKDQEIQKIQQNYQQQLAREKLVNGLMARGVTHPVAVKSAIADFDYNAGVEAIPEYINGIVAAEEYQIFFNKEEVKGHMAPAPVTPSQGSNASWAQVKADLTSNDVSKRKNAMSAVEAHMAKHGKMPW